MSLLRIRPLVMSLVRPMPTIASRWVRPYTVSRLSLISGYGEQEPIDLAAPQPKKPTKQPETASTAPKKEAGPEAEEIDHIVDEPSTVSSHAPGWANPELDRAGLWANEEEEENFAQAGQPKKKGMKAVPQPDLERELGQSKRRLSTSSHRRQEFRRQDYVESPLGEEVKAEVGTVKADVKEDWAKTKESAKEGLADVKESAEEKLNSAKLSATDVKEALKESANETWEKAKKVARKAKEAASEATKPIYFKEDEEDRR